MSPQAHLIVAFICAILIHQAAEAANKNLKKKSIIFDPSTPNVFYCPQEKPAHSDKVLVRARPLEKLCEFNGKPRPQTEASDCYNDLDETEFACQEKKRFQVSLQMTFHR